ncbi:MAG: recombination protein RecR [Gammaproteobacteria bacterium RIFCSPHIGHO2_12_FULL_35_23]|nr:MAG: recombination protein RecR [Gammaproteobacteria bacterium RIFCSPHIGHO2_12_FULL_35_23]
MHYSPLLNKLIEALRYLPGIGPKSAQRMAFYLLDKQRGRGLLLAEALNQAMQNIRHCQYCNNFSETTLCHICANNSRNQQLLCIVETPADIIAIEQTANFRGRYFVLMGHLSPLDGIGPKELHIELLSRQFEQQPIEEVILALSTTPEGEATAHYIIELLKQFKTRITRIAHGVPLGGELEYIDSGTIAHALAGRQLINTPS